MASVVLQLKSLGIADVLSLDYMDPPPPTSCMPPSALSNHLWCLPLIVASVKRALVLLKALQALDEKEELTPTGSQWFISSSYC